MQKITVGASALAWLAAIIAHLLQRVGSLCLLLAFAAALSTDVKIRRV